jgi:hypothetical protein
LEKRSDSFPIEKVQTGLVGDKSTDSVVPPLDLHETPPGQVIVAGVSSPQHTHVSLLHDPYGDAFGAYWLEKDTQIYRVGGGLTVVNLPARGITLFDFLISAESGRQLEWAELRYRYADGTTPTGDLQTIRVNAINSYSHAEFIDASEFSGSFDFNTP